MLLLREKSGFETTYSSCVSKGQRPYGYHTYGSIVLMCSRMVDAAAPRVLSNSEVQKVWLVV